MTALQVTWFLIIGILLTGYAILDGYDLGAGFWYMFAPKDEHRRTILNAIGPFWDGNEVWLLTGGGAIFAAFPHVYATVFSGFYLALMLVLLALMLRACAIEFRNKHDSPGWRKSWDIAFGLGSAVPALLFGVALGNVLHGIPLDESMTYTGNFIGLLNPYSLVIGLTAFFMFAVHGALFIALKTDGELHNLAKGWAVYSWIPFIFLFLIANLYTFSAQPHLYANHQANPVLFAIPLFVFIAIFTIRIFIARKQLSKAFVSSIITIAGLMLMVGIGLFPNIVPASNDPALSLTIYNSSSSALTLKTMFILALIGMPFVVGYTIWVHLAFRGKVSADEDGY